MLKRRAAVALALCLAACSGKKAKEKPAPKPAVEQPADPAVETPAQGTQLDVNAILDTWQTAANARDAETLKSLYASDAVVIPASSGMTMVGPDQIVQFFTEFGDSFPDMKSTEILRLVNGTTIASVARTRGTHTKPMMGMPATNKQTSFTALAVVSIDNSGKIERQVLYADNLSFMAQLGMWEGAHRPYDDSEAPAIRRAAPTGSKAEANNVRLVGAMVDEFNKGDAKTLAGFYAPDAVVSNQAGAGDLKGGEIEPAYVGFFAAFSDAKKSELAMWSAGDWVVSTYLLTATNNGPLKRFGLDKGSGATIRLQVGEVLRVEADKVAEHWIFADGMMIAVSVGAMKVPGMP